YACNAKMIQLYQRDADAVELRVVPGAGFGEQDEKALVRELQRRVGPRMAISIRLVDQFTLSPTGKFRAVISELDREGDGRLWLGWCPVRPAWRCWRCSRWCRTPPRKRSIRRCSSCRRKGRPTAGSTSTT